ncbi:hypothetical protein R6Q57_012860 [Mikania cordata]
MASGNDVIVLGTSTGWLIRHDFGVGDSYDIDLSAGHGDQSIHRVFVDPGGSHCIANVVGNGASDTYYMHAKLAKTQGVDQTNSELHFFIKQRRVLHFAWLSGAGIYHGSLNYGGQNRLPNGVENFVENKALLDYSKLSDGGEMANPVLLVSQSFTFCL